MANTNDGEVIKTRRSRVQEVHLFEVYEYEIELLETGQDAPTLLTWGCSLGSIGIGAILAIATATFQSEAAKFVAYSLATTGNLVAILLIWVWFKKGSGNKGVCARIRARNIESPPVVDPNIDVEEKLSP